MDIDNRRHAMLIGSFLADAFVLGAHWIYDLVKIEKNFGMYEVPRAPLSDSFHKGKELGDYTHYGDQALLLHNHLGAQGGRYATDVFRDHWRAAMRSYAGYMDHATKESLSAFDDGDEYGSHSQELGGAARIVPVVYNIEDRNDALAAAIDQSRLTHNSPDSLMVTELFTRSLHRILEDNAPTVMDAVLAAADDMRDSGHDMDSFDRYLTQAVPLAGHSPAEIASGIGQSCAARYAFPVTLAILSSEDQYRPAMRLNARIGGDSATRGMIVGALIGAREGRSCLPAEWVDTVRTLPTL